MNATHTRRHTPRARALRRHTHRPDRTGRRDLSLAHARRRRQSRSLRCRPPARLPARPPLCGAVWCQRWGGAGAAAERPKTAAAEPLFRHPNVLAASLGRGKSTSPAHGTATAYGGERQACSPFPGADASGHKQLLTSSPAHCTVQCSAWRDVSKVAALSHCFVASFEFDFDFKRHHFEPQQIPAQLP